MPETIFISHSSKDDDTISRLHDELERLTGAEIWVDHKDIKPGDNWQERIDLALRECDYLILAISPDSIASKEVQAEWRYALVINLKVLPVIIREASKEEIPSRLHTINWLMLRSEAEWQSHSGDSEG